MGLKPRVDALIGSAKYRALAPDEYPYIAEAMHEGWNEKPVGPDYAMAIAPKYFNWRKASIYGGSNEIQKNIIAKMVLGF